MFKSFIKQTNKILLINYYINLKIQIKKQTYKKKIYFFKKSKSLNKSNFLVIKL